MKEQWEMPNPRQPLTSAPILSASLLALVTSWREEQARCESEMARFREYLSSRGEDDGPYYFDGKAIAFKVCADDLEALLASQTARAEQGGRRR